MTLLMVGLTGTGLFLQSCSQNSHTFAARTYHNLLARDNAFFLAREKMKEVEKQVYNMREDNFNEILDVIPAFDTTKTKGIADLDDIVKKASMPIRRHKNSVYVDDSYILVGRCRMYKADFKLGMDTYKFVNHKSDDKEAKVEALIYLMRAYMAKNEWDNASTVLEHIEKMQPELRKNKKAFHLTKAQYHRRFEDYDACAKSLHEALPHIRKTDGKSRVHFILGQIYQFENKDSASYAHYKKVLKLNPPYDFYFYTKLYMSQVGMFSKKNTKQKDVDRYFNKLLSDEKNLEYKDKIYYEMAQYELKKKNYRKAEGLFKKSLAHKGANRYQTGASYLALGELYFEKLSQYQLSKVYYDSAVANWDTNHKRYKEISKRHKILTEFATQIEIIERQDSLLKLAAMDSVSLNAFVDKAIERDIAEAKRKLEEEKKKKNRDSDDFGFTGANPNANTSTNPTWYFSNPVLVNNGYTEFTRNWGKRKLEDHWRRSTKELIADYDNPDSPDDDTAAPEEDDEEAGLPKIDRSAYFRDIPFTPEAQEKANTEIKDAMYHLGKIYNFKLDLEDSAVVTFKNQIKRYPDNDHEPEILYLLYLIGKEKNDESLIAFAKEKLYSDHPHSSYTKLLDNPNYLVESKTLSKEAGLLYKDAYSHYNAKDTLATDSLIALYYIQFEGGTSIDDKFAMLKILNELHKKNPDRTPVVDSLEVFMEHYPASNLQAFAENLRDKLSGKEQKNSTVIEDNPTPGTVEPFPVEPSPSSGKNRSVANPQDNEDQGVPTGLPGER